MRKLALSVALVLLFLGSASAQSPKHEMRGAWIATVINLDWPRSANSSTAVKQVELRQMLDDLASAGINSVFFQVRTECDALYDSPFEPWSVYLTGQQGRAPAPFFDPLEFVVEEAHARGMSLHAWLNPFRCEREVGRYALASGHPVLEHPEWMLTLESQSTSGLFHTIMNPGLDAVHEYVAGIVDDIVRRYDVDGIHFDDYFYPYPPYEMGASDLETFNDNPRGFLNLDTWRRDNINRFVARIYDTVSTVKPDAVFGISPFGIWKSGVPQGINGLSAVDALFADAVAWLDEGSVDYIAPQLYWPFGGGQDFGALAGWWSSVSNGRHVYPGLAAYRADGATGGTFAREVVPAQIRFSRSAPGVEGNIHFRAQNIRPSAASSLPDSLISDLYARQAIPPLMAHRDAFPPEAPDAPRASVVTLTGGESSVILEWDPSIFGFVLARSFAVYRAEGETPPDPRSMTTGSEFLLGRAFEPRFVDSPPGTGPYHYVVTALSGNFAESTESTLVTVDGLFVGTEPSDLPQEPSLDVFPNPFSQGVTLSGATGVLDVYDVLGRRVWHEAIPESGTSWTPGPHVVSGLYMFRLTTETGRVLLNTALLVR